MKSILFLSALDFKEKSIQVIRKTPEAFAQDSWSVDYILSRDESKYGPYFYEKVINPTNINVIRFPMPLTALRNSLPNNIFQVIVTKIASYFTIIKLASKASKLLKTKKYDVVYGYEIHGVMALRILKFFGLLKNLKTVSRFQGTWITEYKKNKRYLKLLLNWEAIAAMRFKSDLCIMTDDGTEGDFFFEKRKHIKNFHFWVNGVDKPILNKSVSEEIVKKYKIENTFLFISVCRLESWKRVDRIIRTISLLINKHQFTGFKFLVIGEGSEKQNLIDLAKSENVKEYIEFVGAVAQNQVKHYLNEADIFFSTYDLSNVGNPLLEAIRANKIIFTLNNGTTNKWIQYEENGFIYDVSDRLYEQMSDDVIRVLNDSQLKENILTKIRNTEQSKLWDWKTRLEAEVLEVNKIVNIDK